MNNFRIREFSIERDYQTVAGWYESHRLTPVPQTLLPKLGILIFDGETGEDQGAFWLDMSNSIGVCYLERAVTVPGLSIQKAREVAEVAIGFLKERAASMDYAIMLVRTTAPIARILKGIGFHDSGEVAHCLVSSTREVN